MKKKQKKSMKAYIGIGIVLLIGTGIFGSTGNHSVSDTDSSTTQIANKTEAVVQATREELTAIDSINTQLTTEVTADITTKSPDEGGILEKKLPKKGQQLKVHFINVGQGNAALIQVGDNNYLIDTGKESQYDALNAYLKQEQITDIKDLMITHYDADHMGGADLVIRDYNVEQVSSNPYVETTKDTREVRELNEAIQAKGLSIQVHPYKEEISMGAGAIGKILSPGKDYKDGNENSLVLLVTLGEQSFLFTGDITSKVEGDLLADGLGKVTVAQIAHHGSDYASGILYVKTIAADYAVVSVGENSYGHPTDTVMKRYERFAKNVLRTDVNGTIVFETDGTNMWCNIE